ncbi:hypothetical protein QTP86_029690 [Hemibagrus guttatus]|nr:hypothetical protein QTP86_029690 [Hemibagrus guttatus]
MDRMVASTDAGPPERKRRYVMCCVSVLVYDCVRYMCVRYVMCGYMCVSVLSIWDCERESVGVVRLDISLQDVDIDQCSTDGWFAGTHRCNLTSMEV